MAGWMGDVLQGSGSGRPETLRVVHSATGELVLTATARVLPQGRRVLVSLEDMQTSTPDRCEAVSSLLDRCESLALRVQALRVEVDVPFDDRELRSFHERCGYRAGMTLMTPEGEVYCRHWRPLGASPARASAARRWSLGAVFHH